MTSTSGSLSVSSDETGDGILYDPFLLTAHLIVNPGESETFKRLLRPLLEHFDPDFRLFSIVERSHNKTSNHKKDALEKFSSVSSTTPSLTIMLFYGEEFGTDRLSKMQKYLRQPPWTFHHSINPKGKFSMCPPNHQDFYYLDTTRQEPSSPMPFTMPLWAVRLCHIGKEHVRFMLYTSAENWAEMVEFYSILLGKSTDYYHEDFCYFLIYSQPDLDVQLALKRAEKDFRPKPLDSTMLQFKVREIGSLVPILPNVCSPISENRWATSDYDGNRVLIHDERPSIVNTSRKKIGKSKVRMRSIQYTDTYL